jgi:hypothetical protein
VSWYRFQRRVMWRQKHVSLWMPWDPGIVCHATGGMNILHLYLPSALVVWIYSTYIYRRLWSYEYTPLIFTVGFGRMNILHLYLPPALVVWIYSTYIYRRLWSYEYTPLIFTVGFGRMNILHLYLPSAFLRSDRLHSSAGLWQRSECGHYNSERSTDFKVEAQ